MSQVEHHVSAQQYWRSLEHLAQSPEMREQVAREFPGYDPDALVSSEGTSRRGFLKLMSASLALAGIGLSGCRRWPRENLVPQTSNVEGKIPGIPENYATVMELNGVGHGLLVKSYDGRPIKVEGNAMHPFARIDSTRGEVMHGSADRYAQASVLEVYDPERARSIMQRAGVRYSEMNFDGFLAEAKKFFTGDGADIAVLSESSSGPSFADMKRRFLAKFPKAKWYEYEPLSDDNEREATKIAFGQPLRTQLQLDKADVVFSLDCDFVDEHPAHTRYANDWVKRRKSADQGTMNRVYIAETRLSPTGAISDNRLPTKPSRLANLAVGLAQRLGVPGFSAASDLTPEETKFLDVAGADLKGAGKNAVVTAAAYLPPDVQAVALAINAHIGAIGNTMLLRSLPDADRPTHEQSIRAFAEDLKTARPRTLLILGCNPAYDAPADLELTKLIAAVPHSVHLSLYRNETSIACLWNVPKAHYLESWGDARGYDGTLSVQQPLILPLFGGLSSIEFLAILTGEQVTGGQDIVRRTIGGILGANNNEKAYRRVLCDGLLQGSAPAPVTPAIKTFAAPKLPPANDQFEIRFMQDASLFDGRFAPNAWLQEMPDPLTRLVWDNAAMISMADAKRLGIDNGDMINITSNGKTLAIAAYIMPGHPSGVIGLPLGYGRGQAQHIGSGIGFDTYLLRTMAGLYSAPAQLAKAGGTYKLVTTQDHFIIDELGMNAREKRVGDKYENGIIIREATLAAYKKNPNAAHVPETVKLSLQMFNPPIHKHWEQKNPTAPKVFNEPHAWGMAIDMTACIGCHACVIACQSENNIPVVGKIEAGNHREMHWIRIDRYFKGSAEDPNPEVALQPMMCVHCENAPCEQVCPVGATMHDSEGINVMVYNRCVGTRYCSNNCPYKVRRFNYFDWQSLDPRGGRFPAPWLNLPDTQQVKSVDPIKAMVFNPDVTVRMRGVMEKCTYCVQRIARAKIDAKNSYLAGNRDIETLKDGEVLTACQQACPTQAIVFGNLNDETAAVTALHQNPRAYSVLDELDTRPRSMHLAIIRNPNEQLASAAAEATKEAEHS